MITLAFETMTAFQQIRKKESKSGHHTMQICPFAIIWSVASFPPQLC